MEFGPGDARAVVDGDVEELPAGAGRVDAALAGDPMAGTVEAAQALGVEVDHVARLLVLVAPRRFPGLERGQTVEPEAP